MSLVRCQCRLLYLQFLLPCPWEVGTTTGAVFRGGPVIDGLMVYLAYAAGFGLLVGVLAVAVAFARSALIDRISRILPYINRISGALLIAVGLYVGYYGLYEVRLFVLHGSPTDPVIAGAGRLQSVLAGWVHQHGAWPWVLGLAVFALGVLAVACARRLRGWGRRSRVKRSLS